MIKYNFVYERKKTLSPFWKSNGFYLFKGKSPSFKDALCQVWWKLALCFWGRRFSNFVKEFSLFHYHLPFEIGVTPQLKKKNCIPFIQGCFVLCLVEIGQVVLEETIFKFRQRTFANHYYLPLKKGVPFFWTKLNSRMLCAKFQWNWQSGSGEDIENIKAYRRRTVDQKSSLELPAQLN